MWFISVPENCFSKSYMGLELASNHQAVLEIYKGVFRNQSNICDGAFFSKIVHGYKLKSYA